MAAPTSAPAGRVSAEPLATPDADRIRSLDLLRGFAVLGILYMNIQSFSMPFSAYMNPSSYGDLRGRNLAVWLAGRILVDQKFLSLFAMLFGAGIVLMTSRVEKRKLKPAWLHFRRMGWLMLIGLIHGFLVWSGDILFCYGVCGAAAYWVRKWTGRRLLLVALGLLIFGSALGFSSGHFFPRFPAGLQEMARESWNPPHYRMAEDLAAYRGGWQAQNSRRAVQTFFVDSGAFAFYGWRVLGLLLMGMALLKFDVLTARRSRRFYGWMAGIGFGAGIPLAAYGAWRIMRSGFSFPYANFAGHQYNYWDSLLVSAGWIGLMMLVAQRFGNSPRLGPLAATGQMAFTNYMMQSLICTTIFYGHGLGLYGRVTRVQQLGIVLGVWCFQLTFCTLWLRYFRFGPFEWLWRSLTYRHAQPMRRRPHPPIAAPAAA